VSPAKGGRFWTGGLYPQQPQPMMGAGSQSAGRQSFDMESGA